MVKYCFVYFLYVYVSPQYRTHVMNYNIEHEYDNDVCCFSSSDAQLAMYSCEKHIYGLYKSIMPIKK